MSASAAVATTVAELLELAADAADVCAKVVLTAEDAAHLVALSKRFAERLTAVQALLARQLSAMGDDLPMLNHSYNEREELELSVTKANYVLGVLRTKLADRQQQQQSSTTTSQ